MTNQQFPGASPRPGGGTAITAGVLAILGGLWYLISLGAAIVGMAVGATGIFVIIFSALCAVAAICLVTGGIGLFLKKPAGRPSTILGCAFALVQCAMSGTLVLIADGVTFVETSEVAGISGWAALVITAIPAIVTLVLALAKSTVRWVGQAEPASPLPQP